MRIVSSIAVGLILLYVAEPQLGDFSLWLAVAIAALSLGGVAVGSRSSAS